MRNDQNAFPVTYGNDGVEHGMTLRDYFAAKAMIRMQWNYPQVNASQCYQIADAMLAAREVQS